MPFEEEEIVKIYTPPKTHLKCMSNFQTGEKIDCTRSLSLQIDFPAIKTKNILVVDDDQINILVISKYLKSFNDCKFDLAFNGRQAVDTVLQKSKELFFYDIILMDCNMPIMDGFEATKQIMAMVKESSIPNLIIIASTANASQIEYEKCFESGMTDYLTKPFGKVLLREKLDKYFSSK